MNCAAARRFLQQHGIKSDGSLPTTLPSISLHAKVAGSAVQQVGKRFLPGLERRIGANLIDSLERSVRYRPEQLLFSRQ